MAHSPLYENVPAPPDDATRIDMFLDTADSYADLAETFPLPRKYDLFGSPSRAEYWTVILHAGVLRKFYSAKDQVCLTKVVDSLARMALVDHPVMRGDLIEFRKIATARTVPEGFGLRIGDNDVTQWEIVEVELHGRHLHADWGKWAASLEVREGGRDFFLGQWCRTAADLVDIAKRKIRWYQEEGFIDGPAGS
ncbi:hypothetical protein MK786_01130 [Microbacterium sp. CFH 31415]|uniref:hypothetical protein n=1 Tax=Microbacterium sp. CFH 31415 TaxID=2921732 RepID=UPI001F13CE64|nr:hypothetical protein [Microbacterium sp. CFH 31415]MCH6229342.1 hypothetical protein [Microbacterium sp. CFH 31415]